jgi:hypothetical protein
MGASNKGNSPSSRVPILTIYMKFSKFRKINDHSRIFARKPTRIYTIPCYLLHLPIKTP